MVMSMNSDGAITTYKSQCSKYEPMKDQPLGIKDVQLGNLYKCRNFRFNNNELWKKDIESGHQYCHVCIFNQNELFQKIRKWVNENKSSLTAFRIEYVPVDELLEFLDEIE